MQKSGMRKNRFGSWTHGHGRGGWEGVGTPKMTRNRNVFKPDFIFKPGCIFEPYFIFKPDFILKTPDKPPLAANMLKLLRDVNEMMWKRCGRDGAAVRLKNLSWER